MSTPEQDRRAARHYARHGLRDIVYRFRSGKSFPHVPSNAERINLWRARYDLVPFDEKVKPLPRFA